MNETEVMIITPYPDFGNLVSDSLSIRKSWNVSSISSVRAVEKDVESRRSLDYVLIDLDLGMDRTMECAFIIREKFPFSNLILITKGDLPTEVDDLFPWKILHKPFIERDLMELFSTSDTYQSQVIESVFVDPSAYSLPVWAENKEKLASTLTATMPALDAVSAYIYTSDGILAHSVKSDAMPVNASCSSIQQDLGTFDRGEVLKPVSVASSKYVLHGTVLAVGIILAILYHEDTPYEIARKQTRYLTARITSRSLEETKYLSLPPKVKVETLEELESVVRDLEPSSTADTQPVRTILPTNPQTRERSSTKPIVGSRQRIDQWPEEIPTKKKINVRKAPSVGDIKRIEYELKPGTITLDSASHDRYDAISTMPRAVQLDRQFTMDVPTPGSVRRKSDFMRPPSDQKLSPEHRFRSGVRTSGGFEPSRQASGWEEPRHAPDRAVKSRAGGRSRQLYYACLLIPRFVSTPIQGEVRNILAEEMANICISNGWRLESVQIDKDSLQWIVLLPANISPARHIKIIRELTSNLVLPYFSNVNRDGLLKDFWAPGHLLESGSEPILSEEIEEFIAENRAQYYSGQDYPRTGR